MQQKKEHLRWAYCMPFDNSSLIATDAQLWLSKQNSLEQWANQ